MTRRISLVAGVAVLALFVVPAAFGEGRLAGSQEPSDFWNYQSNAKVADTSPGVAPQDLAKLFAGSRSDLGTNHTAVRSPDIDHLLLTKSGVVDSSSAEAIDPTSGPVDVSTTDPGTEIEWRQIGIGLGVGVLFVLGLGLATRIAHVRPFAH